MHRRTACPSCTTRHDAGGNHPPSHSQPLRRSPLTAPLRADGLDSCLSPLVSEGLDHPHEFDVAGVAVGDVSRLLRDPVVPAIHRSPNRGESQFICHTVDPFGSMHFGVLRLGGYNCRLPQSMCKLEVRGFRHNRPAEHLRECPGEHKVSSFLLYLCLVSIQGARERGCRCSRTLLWICFDSSLTGACITGG